MARPKRETEERNMSALEQHFRKNRAGIAALEYGGRKVSSLSRRELAAVVHIMGNVITAQNQALHQQPKDGKDG